jgi:hypothetical protein
MDTSQNVRYHINEFDRYLYEGPLLNNSSYHYIMKLNLTGNEKKQKQKQKQKMKCKYKHKVQCKELKILPVIPENIKILYDIHYISSDEINLNIPEDIPNTRIERLNVIDTDDTLKETDLEIIRFPEVPFETIYHKTP